MSEGKVDGMIRYSPRPIEAYSKRIRLQQVGQPDTFIESGPAGSYFLSKYPQAWNLAFLSHPFEDGTPMDPHLSTNAYKTTQEPLGSGTVADLMGLRPTLAVQALKSLPTLPKTPMFVAYGPAWVATMEARALLLAGVVEDVPDVLAASLVLQRFRLK